MTAEEAAQLSARNRHRLGDIDEIKEQIKKCAAKGLRVYNYPFGAIDFSIKRFLEEDGYRVKYHCGDNTYNISW